MHTFVGMSFAASKQKLQQRYLQRHLRPEHHLATDHGCHDLPSWHSLYLRPVIGKCEFNVLHEVDQYSLHFKNPRTNFLGGVAIS